MYLHLKYPVILSDFNESLNLERYFGKNNRTLNFMKPIQWEPSYSTRIETDRKTDVRTDVRTNWQTK